MGDRLEPLSQREAFQEGQGTTAMLALHELSGAQAPFLVNNNAFLQALWQVPRAPRQASTSQVNCPWDLEDQPCAPERP